MAGVYALTAADLGGAVAWIAPTYRNSRPLWRFVEQHTSGTPVTLNRSERIASFPSGGWIGVYSGDSADSVRGEAFDVVIVDEAARIDETAWSDAIQPTLADRNGRALLISTPHGRNWFWREYQRGVAREAGYNAFTAPSSNNPNPNIQAAAQAAQERVSERTYRQEWLAEFVEDAGGVFRRVADCVTSERPAPYPGQFAMGVDWGRSNDYTVLVVLDMRNGQVVDIDRYNQIDWGLQRGRLRVMAERWKPTTILAEENSIGDVNISALREDGLSVRGFNTTSESKGAIIDALTLAFERGDIRIPDDPVLINELQSYEMERLPSGTMRYGAPSGMHDDCVMALALAWHAGGRKAKKAFMAQY